MMKAQYALEHLMNYAIVLAILLGISGGLYYYGVFDVSPPDQCIFSNEFFCKEYVAKTGQEIIIILENRVGDDVNVHSAEYKVIGSSGTTVCDESNCPLTSTPGGPMQNNCGLLGQDLWTHGSKRTITIPCTVLNKDDYVSVEASFLYKKPGGIQNKRIIGTAQLTTE